MSIDIKPELGMRVKYRGRIGRHAPRVAIVTADQASIVGDAVEVGDLPGLDSDMHVHLWVFSAGMESGGFRENNVGPGTGPGQWEHLPAEWR